MQPAACTLLGTVNVSLNPDPSLRAIGSATQALNSAAARYWMDQMRDFRDAKAIAKTVRERLAARGLKLSQSDSLELTAHAFGVADWNTLSAEINRAGSAQKPKSLSDQTDTDEAASVEWPEIARPFYERHLTPDDKRRRSEPWTQLFDEANDLYRRGVEATSPEVLDLARRWTERSTSDADLKQKYAAAYREALADPAVAPHLPVSRDVLVFLAPAFQQFRSGPQSEPQQ
jgi:Glyoxalase superfamily protein